MINKKIMLCMSLLCAATGLQAHDIANHLAQATTLRKHGDNQKAIAQLRQALDLEPANHDATSLLVDLLDESGDYDAACTVLQQALCLAPHNVGFTHRLACLCINIGRVEEALDGFNDILNQIPHSTQTMYNSAYTLKMAGRVDEAIALYEKILMLQPDYESAEFALGHAYLYKGDFNKGWQQHEHYLKRSHKNSELLRTLLLTNQLADKIILLRPEGGLGDTLQFIRYAQLLKEKGATIIAAVQKPLVPLLTRCPYIDTVVPVQSPLPPCHEWVALMSLPAIFNSDEVTIPKNIPYLYPDPALVEQWGNFFQTNTHFKIGICWQADVFNDSSRPRVARRGMSLTHFYLLAQMPNISLYSLQQKDGTEQIQHMPAPCTLNVFDEQFDNAHGAFMDSAAVMKHLDLVITVDTAIAHLAGALGTKVWLLLPYATDWRWIVGRTDTPWYPSMRIFKQPNPFDWESVMHEVEKELKMLVEDK
ncbi:MAG: tetratricopeptide repeat protein [Candidatus Dependentiae bacterium]|nr:tetratricopeptide repeat protein [Candidatus Dependentiae bacterium]